jgi:phage terminase small subunit
MSEENKLTGKQKLFADAYIGKAHFNARKAAEMAGYNGDCNSLAVIGSQNLRKLNISSYIEEKLKNFGMGANEVLTRLARIVNGDVDDFLSEDGFFDLKKARQNGKTPLLKKLKQKRTIKQKKTEVRDDMRGFLAEDEVEAIESDVEIIYEEVEFEMYSAHEALRDLGKFHKLFTDKTELSGTVQTVGLTKEEFEAEAAKNIAQAKETLNKFDGE